jgi:thiol-disulfide isomerase/thioredoxin
LHRILKTLCLSSAARRRLGFAGLALAAAVLAATIVSISRPGASPEGARCANPPPALGTVLAPDAPARAPDVALVAVGGERPLRALLAGGAVVNLWATWCAPCVREMPALDRLKGALAADGIAVLALSEDRGPIDGPQQFFAANGIRALDVLIDPSGRVAREAKVRGLPTTLLYGPDGVERVRVEGVAEWDAPEAWAFLRRCIGRG